MSKTTFKKGQLVVLTETQYTGCGGERAPKGTIVKVVSEPDRDGDIRAEFTPHNVYWVSPGEYRPLNKGYETINGKKFHAAGKTFQV